MEKVNNAIRDCPNSGNRTCGCNVGGWKTVNGLVRSITCVLVIGAISLAACKDAWHPEWGPTPPVAPYSLNNLPAGRVTQPIIFPVLGETRWQDGYNEVRGKFRHTGIDIKAPKMTPIVAPFSGKLGMKKMSFWIYGDSGWTMLGTHLNDDNIGTQDGRGDHDVMFAPDLHPGQHVVAGQFIGYVGESGDATAPHLHFEMYAPGDGPTMARIRNPFDSLKAAHVIQAPIACIPSPKRKPRNGEKRFVGCVRKVDIYAGTVTMLLSASQIPNGKATVSTVPQYRKVKITQAQLRSVGGWSAIRALAPYRRISAYVPDIADQVVRPTRQFVIEAQ